MEERRASTLVLVRFDGTGTGPVGQCRCTPGQSKQPSRAATMQRQRMNGYEWIKTKKRTRGQRKEKEKREERQKKKWLWKTDMKKIELWAELSWAELSWDQFSSDNKSVNMKYANGQRERKGLSIYMHVLQWSLMRAHVQMSCSLKWWSNVSSVGEWVCVGALIPVNISWIYPRYSSCCHEHNNKNNSSDHNLCVSCVHLCDNTKLKPQLCHDMWQRLCVRSSGNLIVILVVVIMRRQNNANILINIDKGIMLIMTIYTAQLSLTWCSRCHYPLNGQCPTQRHKWHLSNSLFLFY